MGSRRTWLSGCASSGLISTRLYPVVFPVAGLDHDDLALPVGPAHPIDLAVRLVKARLGPAMGGHHGNDAADPLVPSDEGDPLAVRRPAGLERVVHDLQGMTADQRLSVGALMAVLHAHEEDRAAIRRELGQRVVALAHRLL